MYTEERVWWLCQNSSHGYKEQNRVYHVGEKPCTEVGGHKC